MSDAIDAARKLLHTDALAAAEEITGKSYKDDDTTMAIGFIGHLSLTERKAQALQAIGDTNYRQSLYDHLDVFVKLGFEIVYTEDFLANEYGYKEKIFILWHHEKGILGVVESYGGDRINHSNIYYNVQLNSLDDIWKYTSSHGAILDDLVLQGNHDTREGLRVAINGLEKIGEFMPVWKYNSVFALATYVEWKIPDVNYKAITAKRISNLPQEVQDAIKNKN